MLPYLPLGPFILQTTGLALLIGVWIGIKLVEKEAIRLKINPDWIYNLVFIGLVSGLIGARLSYASRSLNVYLQNPLSFISLNTNTLSPGDGLIIGLVAAFIYGWRKQLPFRTALDVLTPGLSIFLVFFGASHFLNGDAFGSPTSAPWSIYLWDADRHPSQVYEILAALFVFIIVWKRPLAALGQGINFLTALALTAAARVFLETFRGDSLFWPGGFRSTQVVGLLVVMAALWLMRSWAEPGVKRAEASLPVEAHLN